MPVSHTIDASVFINAFNPHEEGHEASNAFLRELRVRELPMFAPTLLLAEVAAAIRRGHGDSQLARRFAAQLFELPRLFWIPIDASLARLAAEIAAEHALRGSDSIYAAVAQRFKANLVTRDREHLERLSEVLPVFTPREALNNLGETLEGP